MSYYTFQLSEGKKFELTLSSPSAPSTDADFYIALGRLPAVDDYDARIADQYSSGSFLGHGAGTWVLGVLAWYGEVQVQASLQISDGDGASGIVGGGGGGDGSSGDSGGGNCTAPCQCGVQTAWTGNLSDGDGQYSDDASCWWIIAPEGAQNVSATFSEASVEEGYDFLRVFECHDFWCLSKTLVWEHSGYATNTRIFSFSGIMLITLESDECVTEAGYNSHAILTSNRITLYSFATAMRRRHVQDSLLLCIHVQGSLLSGWQTT
jgi:hypothetical protein